MPFPTVSDAMAGELEITINHADSSSVTINSNFVGAFSPNHTQVVRTSDRLSGTTSRPTNQLDNPSTSVPIYLNEWSDVQYLMPDSMDGEAFVLGSGGNCVVPEPAEVIFHYVCDGEDTSKDMRYPVADIGFEDTGERNATDELAVNFIFYPRPNAEGQVVYGNSDES